MTLIEYELALGKAMAQIMDFNIQYLCDDKFAEMADKWLVGKWEKAKNWTTRRKMIYIREALGDT